MERGLETVFYYRYLLGRKNVTVYALANCRWMISHSVTGKQTISTLVDDVDDPFLKIENNALQTVCADAIAQYYGKYYFKRHLNLMISYTLPHPIASACKWTCVRK